MDDSRNDFLVLERHSTLSGGKPTFLTCELALLQPLDQSFFSLSLRYDKLKFVGHLLWLNFEVLILICVNPRLSAAEFSFAWLR